MSNTLTPPVLLLVIGVSGCGKSTVGKALADKYGFTFFEGDDFHSAEAKKHMASGQPLTDEMREPWIQRMCDGLQDNFANGTSCVLAYSGLRRSQRQRFRALGVNTRFILLNGSQELIKSRMEARADHFMPSSLLDSQFASLDMPENEPDIVDVDISAPIPTIVEKVESIAHAFIQDPTV